MRFPFLFFLLCTTLFWRSSNACSMYKVTVGGKTMVGNNEDSWRHDACIWFEPGTPGEYGVACVGYASNMPKPDGAMNEVGLVYDAFTMPYQSNIPARDIRKKDFTYADIKIIMRQCKTVDEVYAYLKPLNLQVLNGSPLFNGGMLLFVDRSGKYLVVEAHHMSLGQKDRFALANFSFANTPDLSIIKTERYCKGITYLNNKPLSCSFDYCRNLSDTMSVHRPKIGDGTLYTSMYDLEQGLVHLFFFHNFREVHTLNLKNELAQGPHAYLFKDLFPNNAEYQRFDRYQTPQNNRGIAFFILGCALLFLFSTAYFLLRFMRSKLMPYRKGMLGLSIMNFCFLLYMLVLYRNEAIFYFPSPYSDAHSLFVSISSYWPFIVLLSVVPLVRFMYIIFRKKAWSRLASCLFALNNLVYLVCLVLFFYWGLFGL